MWQMLRVCGVRRKLLKAVEIFNVVIIWACVRVGNDESEVSGCCWIETRLCEISMLFNIYLDSVVREVNVRVLGKGLGRDAQKFLRSP